MSGAHVTAAALAVLALTGAAAWSQVAGEAAPGSPVATPPAELPVAPPPEAAPPEPVVRAPPPPPPAPVIPAKRPRSSAAFVQMLDKVTAKSVKLTLEVGKTVYYGDLIFTVRACETNAADEERAEAVAYMQIEARPKAAARQPATPRSVFRGWMYASSPSLAAFQHPIYDVWLIGCRPVVSPTAPPMPPAPLRPAAAPVAKAAPAAPVPGPAPAAPAAPAPAPIQVPPPVAAPPPAPPPSSLF